MKLHGKWVAKNMFKQKKMCFGKSHLVLQINYSVLFQFCLSAPALVPGVRGVANMIIPNASISKYLNKPTMTKFIFWYSVIQVFYEFDYISDL